MENLEITDTLVGSGTAIEKGALISCHYEGFLEDGTKFDSSKDRGRPLEFVVGVGRVIKGWDMGLMGMKVGGKRTLHIHHIWHTVIVKWVNIFCQTLI